MRRVLSAMNLFPASLSMKEYGSSVLSSDVSSSSLRRVVFSGRASREKASKTRSTFLRVPISLSFRTTWHGGQEACGGLRGNPACTNGESMCPRSAMRRRTVCPWTARMTAHQLGLEPSYYEMSHARNRRSTCSTKTKDCGPTAADG